MLRFTSLNHFKNRRAGHSTRRAGLNCPVMYSSAVLSYLVGILITIAGITCGNIWCVFKIPYVCVCVYTYVIKS